MPKDSEDLFDNIERDFMGPSDYSESAFKYLNRSSRPEFAYLRSVLEEWFSEYDADDQKRKRLRGEFRSQDEDKHYSAFFELYLYRLLCSLGYKVQIEPDWPIRNPDFLIETSSGEKVLVEATVVYPQKWFGPDKKREQQILDYINHKLDSPDFFLRVEILNRTNTNPSLKRILNFIQLEMQKYDADLIINQTVNPSDLGFTDLPSFVWQSGGWRIKFTLIPKKPETRGKHGSLPIGVIHYGVSFSNSADHIKSRIDSKYGHYGELNIPYVLAINVLDSYADEYDYSIALFGEEYFVLPSGESGRHPNGAWYGPNGYQKKRLSGIMFCRNLFPSSIDKKTPVLWHHPYANHPLEPNLWKLPQQVARDGRLEFIDGLEAPELLGIELGFLYC